MSFIKLHLISKIKKRVVEKNQILQSDGFLFLEKPIVYGNKKINRLNKWNIYPKEELLPISWFELDGKALIDINSQLKNDNFYIYKILDGKSHKMRIKKKK